jgi:hypothetical protein
MDGSPGGHEAIRLAHADRALLRPAVGINGGREIIAISAAHPVEAGLARQQELADQLTGPSSAPLLLVWRSEPALLVSRTETRLPHFEDALTDMRAAGWPVVLRKSGGGACPVGRGTVQVSMIDPILPLTTINGRYAVLAELLQATLRRYSVLADPGLVAAAYCPGTYDFAVAGPENRRHVAALVPQSLRGSLRRDCRLDQYRGGAGRARLRGKPLLSQCREHTPLR